MQTITLKRPIVLSVFNFAGQQYPVMTKGIRAVPDTDSQPLTAAYVCLAVYQYLTVSSNRDSWLDVDYVTARELCEQTGRKWLDLSETERVTPIKLQLRLDAIDAINGA